MGNGREMSVYTAWRMEGRGHRLYNLDIEIDNTHIITAFIHKTSTTVTNQTVNKLIELSFLSKSVDILSE